MERLLKLKEVEHCILSAAFVNMGGVALVSQHIKPIAKQVTFYAGIRNDITSRQALEALLDLGVKLYVVDTGSRRVIFHPKIYAARSKVVGHLLIGSANFTAGGLNNNIEGGVSLDLDLKDAADSKLYKSIEDEFAGLQGKHPKHVFQITNAAELKKLEDEDRLLDETKVEPPRPITISKSSDGSGTTLEKIKLAVKPVYRAIKKPPKPKAPTPAPKVVDETQIEPSTSVAWDFVWESKELERRDLNIPKGNDSTNVTGSISLDKGKLDTDVDHRHYFRDEVFQNLSWKTGKVKTVDEAHATFQLVIAGVDHGEFTLRIAHTTSKEASYHQNNAMTRLSWGEVKKYVAKEQYLGRTMSLYRDSNDPQRFMIEID